MKNQVKTWFKNRRNKQKKNSTGDGCLSLDHVGFDCPASPLQNSQTEDQWVEAFHVQQGKHTTTASGFLSAVQHTGRSANYSIALAARRSGAGSGMSATFVECGIQSCCALRERRGVGDRAHCVERKEHNPSANLFLLSLKQLVCLTPPTGHHH